MTSETDEQFMERMLKARAEYANVSAIDADRLFAIFRRGVDAAARIEELEAEVKVWVNHTKTAVWSDSEECKMLSSEVERLLKSRNRWAKKYNDLLAKRRLEDGYDVYAAAREERTNCQCVRCCLAEQKPSGWLNPDFPEQVSYTKWSEKCVPLYTLDAAIALVLEEAAKVAEGMNSHGMFIADAIRALAAPSGAMKEGK